RNERSSAPGPLDQAHISAPARDRRLIRHWPYRTIGAVARRTTWSVGSLALSRRARSKRPVDRRLAAAPMHGRALGRPPAEPAELARGRHLPARRPWRGSAHESSRWTALRSAC